MPQDRGGRGGRKQSTARKRGNTTHQHAKNRVDELEGQGGCAGEDVEEDTTKHDLKRKLSRTGAKAKRQLRKQKTEAGYQNPFQENGGAPTSIQLIPDPPFSVAESIARSNLSMERAGSPLSPVPPDIASESDPQ